ncbi:MAG: pentapeptide repeat-containing protein [Nostoc indistinguendum CM1-VF10]|nr:pentapeptide repeat-containing protein [Nostoc indistinguendum CM1-VF10]
MAKDERWLKFQLHRVRVSHRLNANLHQAALERTNFTAANLENANLEGTILEGGNNNLAT